MTRASKHYSSSPFGRILDSHVVTLILEATKLGKRYRHKWALSDCTLSIPEGHVVGIVGPNGSGKSTLLNLAAGLLAPSSGKLNVLGGPPARDAIVLGRVGFVAQDPPVFSSLSVNDHLRFGAHLNRRWDTALAEHRIEDVGLDPKQRAGKLSGGQRAQLALILAIAKHPELLLLDEPVASLDPVSYTHLEIDQRPKADMRSLGEGFARPIQKRSRSSARRWGYH